MTRSKCETLLAFSRFVSHLEKVLIPTVELSCCVYLVDPEVYNIKVVTVEDLLLICCCNLHVVTPLREVPLCLSYEFKSCNLIQIHDVVRLMWELVCRFVRDEYTFNWIQVDQPGIVYELGYMHLVDVSFDAN